VVGTATTAANAALQGLDPATLVVRWSIALTSPAVRIVVTEDGQFAYLSLPLESAVAQVNLATRSEVRRFAIAPAGAVSYAMDIAPRPGQPETIAVAIGNVGAAAPFKQLAVFDAGVRRSRTLEWATPNLAYRASEIEFVDADTLVSFDNETTAFTLARFSLDANGLIAGPATEGACCFLSALEAAGGGEVFLNAGVVFNAMTLKSRMAYPAFARPLASVRQRGSVVGFSLTADGISEPRLQLDVTVYNSARGYVERMGRIDVPTPWSPNVNVNAEVVATLGSSTNAIAWIEDVITGDAALISARIDDVPPRSSQVSIRTAMDGTRQAVAVNVLAQDMAYAADVDRLLATVPGEYGPQGSSLAVINPLTAEVDRFILLSSSPHAVYTSGRDGLAYVTLPSEQALQQVDVRTGQLGWKLRPDDAQNLGGLLPSSYGLQVSSVAFKPDDASTLAVSLAGSRFLGVALARGGSLLGGLARPPGNTTESADIITFNGPGEVVGLELSSSADTLSRYAVNATNLTYMSSTGSALTDRSGTTDFAFGRMYSLLSIGDVASNTLVATVAFSPRMLEEIALFDANSGAGVYMDGVAGTAVVQRLAIRLGGVGERSGEQKITDAKLQIRGMGRHGFVRAGAARTALRTGIYSTGQGEIYLLDPP
jgi:hypothetical protein